MKLDPNEFKIILSEAPEAGDDGHDGHDGLTYEVEIEVADEDGDHEAESVSLDADDSEAEEDDDSEAESDDEEDGDESDSKDSVIDPGEEHDDEHDDERNDEESEVEFEESDDEDEPIDWAEVFGGDTSWTAPKGDQLDAAKVIAEAINDGVQAYEKGTPIGDRPYTPLAAAAAKDRVIIYNEKDLEGRRLYKEEAAQVSNEAKAIAGQLRRVLFTRSVGSVVRDQRRGKLDRRKLHTLNLPGRAQPNKRVFLKKVEGQTQDVAIGILVDQSGSMSCSDKIGAARKAAIALGDALNTLKPLGVKFGIWGFDANGSAGHAISAEFNDRSDPLRLHWYKGFAEDWGRVAPRIGQMKAHSNNVDGESVRWAAQQLLDCDSPRRILFVLSDGQPAVHNNSGSGQSRLCADLHLAIEQVEAAGVEIVGIGFMSNTVKTYYKKCTIVRKQNELGAKILGLIRDAFNVRGYAA